jgi:hypothetical protein
MVVVAVIDKFQEEFEEINRGKSKMDRQHNDQKKKGQKDKQRSTKHTHKA